MKKDTIKTKRKVYKELENHLSASLIHAFGFWFDALLIWADECVWWDFTNIFLYSLASIKIIRYLLTIVIVEFFNLSFLDFNK